jgi:hypothetical protein
MITAAEFYKWLKIFKVGFGATGGVTINTGPGLSGGGFVPLGGSLDLTGTSGSENWQEITAASATLAVNKSYVINNASKVDLTLPASSVLGDKIEVYGKGAGGWKIKQLSLQQIIIGENVTTVGALGSAESTYQSDILILRCITANNVWSAFCPSGNISLN